MVQWIISIVLSSTASESASLQYIAPYAGTALAEYFMYKGKDVLYCISDDLSKHAASYRALSLLLERCSPDVKLIPVTYSICVSQDCVRAFK
ncbi:MAG: hypothetical protein ACLUR5_11525 [Eubacterium ventriosum]